MRKDQKRRLKYQATQQLQQKAVNTIVSNVYQRMRNPLIIIPSASELEKFASRLVK